MCSGNSRRRERNAGRNKHLALHYDAVPGQATAMAKVIGSFQDRAHRLQDRSSPTAAYPGSLISHRS